MNKDSAGPLSSFAEAPLKVASTYMAGAAIMKSFSDPSFFRTFELLIGSSNPGLKQSRWTFDEVEFERERMSRNGPKFGLSIEIYTLSRAGRRGWCLLVVKEYWWAGQETEAVKTVRWARPISGHRVDIIDWLRLQEKKVGRA